MAPRSPRGVAGSACFWALRPSPTVPSRPGSSWWGERCCSSSGPHSSGAREAELMYRDQDLTAAGGGSPQVSPGIRGCPATAIKPSEHETLDRIITGLVTVVPMLLLGL